MHSDFRFARRFSTAAWRAFQGLSEIPVDDHPTVSGSLSSVQYSEDLVVQSLLGSRYSRVKGAAFPQ